MQNYHCRGKICILRPDQTRMRVDESAHESFVNSPRCFGQTRVDERLASGVGQQTNIIDELRIEDTQSYKEWTTSNLKRFLQQTASTFAALVNSHDRSNAHKLVQSLN